MCGRNSWLGLGIRGNGHSGGMLLVTCVLASSQQAWDPIAASSAQPCSKTSTAALSPKAWQSLWLAAEPMVHRHFKTSTVHRLIRQVCCFVARVSGIVGNGQPAVAWPGVIRHDLWLGGGQQHVAPDIKLLPVEQQRVGNVATSSSVCVAGLGLRLSSVSNVVPFNSKGLGVGVGAGAGAGVELD